MFNRRFIFLFLLSLIVVCAIPLIHTWTFQAKASSTSSPAVSIAYRYYPITGTTASELRSQMAARGPRDHQEGRSYDARVDWAVKWSYRHGRMGNQCRIRNANTRVSVTYTMPKWNIPPGAERSLIADWHRYLAALQLHEDGHKNHGVEAGQDILNALSQLPAAHTCPALEATAQATAQAVIKTYNQKDSTYDLITRHGYTQGAIFPNTTTVSR
ncbi:MAG: DUF922 domain-containing protein [Leptolyngbyaceae cyanobacterium bins.349]|nr:DUF922 domain-containing protein [Leptolyngbyaceae cyanobacterium bins.349]